MLPRITVFGLLLVACARPAQQAGISDCSGTEARQIAGEGTKYIRIGMNADSISRRCHVLSDTTELDDEAQPLRVVRVLVGDRDTIGVDVVKNSVWRISVDRRGPATSDSLGVGTSLQRLLTLGGLSGREGEGRLYLESSRRCGLSFRLNYVPGTVEHKDLWTEADISRLPGSSTVDEVLIIGCQPRP